MDHLGMKGLCYASSSGSWKACSDVVSDQFPAGLRVLVVDDDPTCLRILEKMLNNCLYEVTTCNRAEIALEFLRDSKNGYDIVLSDVHMPDMDGFKLLEHIGLEMDLPVIMMSADDSKHVVMKGVTHGACDYLIKPVRMEALKNIWQHIVRKKKNEGKDRDFEPSGSAENGEHMQKLYPDDADCSSSGNEGNWKNSKKRKDDEEGLEERDDHDTSALKKPRVVWSVELHQQFVNAVNQLGIDKAVPKKILELMNVPGITRENVASHLQKYRLYLRRLSGVSQLPNGMNKPFMGAQDTYGPLSGIDLQALAASGQLPPQSLATIQAAAFGRANTKPTLPIVPFADQRNVFCFENPKLRYVDGRQSTNGAKQVNLLHGIPTNMDSKQLASLYPSGSAQSQTTPMVQIQPSHGCNNPHSSLGRPVLSRAVPSSSLLCQNGGIENVCGNSISRTRNSELSGTSNLVSKLHDEVLRSDVKSSAVLPSYDVFSDLHHITAQDWPMISSLEDPRLPNLRGGLNVSPSVLAQTNEGFVNNPNIVRSMNSSLIADNSLRIKAERLPDMGIQNGLLNEHYGQDDLMSAILKQQQTMAPSDRELGFEGYHLDNLPA